MEIFDYFFLKFFFRHTGFGGDGFDWNINGFGSSGVRFGDIFVTLGGVFGGIGERLEAGGGGCGVGLNVVTGGRAVTGSRFIIC
mgnify:CR=1 FL=1